MSKPLTIEQATELVMRCRRTCGEIIASARADYGDDRAATFAASVAVGLLAGVAMYSGRPIPALLEHVRALVELEVRDAMKRGAS